jgi:hypothetical protein
MFLFRYAPDFNRSCAGIVTLCLTDAADRLRVLTRLGIFL